jgi:predicted transcriptional regulator
MSRMARSRSTIPTDRELDILHVLWNAGAASVSQIRAALAPAQPIAATTVSTMLKVMEDKGLAERTEDRRWQARISRDDAGRGLIDRLLDRIFDGSAERLVAHVVESRPLSADEIAQLRELLAQSRASSKASRANVKRR